MSAVFSPGYDLTRGPQLRIAPATRGSPRIYNFMVQTVINRLNIWCQLSCSSLPSDSLTWNSSTETNPLCLIEAQNRGKEQFPCQVLFQWTLQMVLSERTYCARLSTSAFNSWNFPSKAFWTTGRFVLNVGVRNPFSIENSSLCMWMALTCGDKWEKLVRGQEKAEFTWSVLRWFPSKRN